MSFPLQPIALGLHASETYLCANAHPAGGTVAESPSPYRPRHPERSAFYQLFETHFDSYVRAYEERFEAQKGPLRPVVVRSVEEFLSCGRLQGGFARIRCPKCHAEHLLAYSCRTRNFCSSCQAKRSVLFAEKLAAEILAPAPHRHWTFSIPRVLRGLFERERSLPGLLSQTAYASILKTFQALLDRKDVRPGCVLSLQTHGAYGANFNPHCHGLAVYERKCAFAGCCGGPDPPRTDEGVLPQGSQSLEGSLEGESCQVDCAACLWVSAANMRQDVSINHCIKKYWALQGNCGIF